MTGQVSAHLGHSVGEQFWPRYASHTATLHPWRRVKHGASRALFRVGQIDGPNASMRHPEPRFRYFSDRDVLTLGQ